MRKSTATLLAIVAVLCFSSTAAKAEGFLIKGGFNYSHFDPENIGAYNAWFAGVGYQTYGWNGFALQPELVYRVNGAKFEDAATLRMNYLELPVNIQWGIDLLVAKPYIFVAPFVGCNLGNVVTPEGHFSDATIRNAVRLLDYGCGAGFGIDFWYLQLTAKYNWMFGPVADWGAFVDSLAGVKINMATFEVALAIKF
ncbi:MAG: PorT family protein [Bacteroidales bacterium]|nr:PorT family protein [Bacteroidales bacterium]